MSVDESVITAHISTDNPFSDKTFKAPFKDIPASGYYQIEDIRQSECALILFARHTLTSERIVMKILREYKDTRYSLATLDERQQCQLEALKRNRVFTPEVYIGLARIDYLELPQGCFPIEEIIKTSTSGSINLLGLEQGRFSINEIIVNPTQEMLDRDAEYTLIMHQLPEKRCLDRLLSEESEDALIYYMRLLSKYVAHMHTYLIKPLDAGEEEIQWGSYEQLWRKLIHNLELLDLVLTTQQNGRCRCDASNQLEDRFMRLKDTLKQIFTGNNYRQYFDQRLAQQRIKHCHGDLKAPHIWIASHDSCCEQEPWEHVSLLDAADFNPSYTHIDVLSDLALLVVDVQARTQSAFLADLLMENYLLYTDQQDGPSRAVLAYYLVEKAIVGAAISIVYDDLPDLGLKLLEIARSHLQCLIERSALI